MITRGNEERCTATGRDAGALKLRLLLERRLPLKRGHLLRAHTSPHCVLLLDEQGVTSNLEGICRHYLDRFQLTTGYACL